METELAPPPVEKPRSTETILVVDDDDGVRETVVEILQFGGQRCLSVASVAAAIETVASQPIDLVITDMHMPGQSGLDLIERLQKMDDSIPVILITGFPSIPSAINAFKRGAIEFLTKPFDIDTITRVVAKALHERKLRLEVRRLQAESHKTELIEKLNRQLHSRVEELTRLYMISDAMSQMMDTDDLFDYIVKLASDVTGAQRVSLMIMDRGRRNLKIRASIGLPPEVVTSTKVRVGQGISGKVAHEKKLVRATRHAHQTVAVRGDSLGLGLYASNSWLSAPLLIAGEIFGVLNLTDKPDRSDFNQEEEQIIQVLVDKAGTKLENQALYEGIYANLIDTLNSLVTTIEAKDPYTRKHSHRVAEYAMTIARHLKISEEEIELIEFASMLHDIGKIGVRDEILTKPGKLTDAEYEAIKAHVTIGEKIVEPLGLTPAERSIIRNHHERFDGKGYPDRLKGEEIPFLTRVVSVADAFDAITSSRPYRKALTADEAVAEFKKLKGLQFDPVAAEAAIEAIACGKLRILAEWPSPPPVETAQAAIAESRGARA